MTPFAICMLVAAIVFFLDAARVPGPINFTALSFGFCALAVLFNVGAFR